MDQPIWQPSSFKLRQDQAYFFSIREDRLSTLPVISFDRQTDVNGTISTQL